jgi:hypothetical protein
VTQRQGFLLTVKPISQAPHLGAAGRHQDVQTLSISDLELCCFAFENPQFRVGQRHVGTASKIVGTGPVLYQQFTRVLANGQGRSRAEVTVLWE